MKKSKQINSALQNPTWIGQINANELADWAEQYPYFQALQCIYLKKLFIEQRFQYPIQLRKTAALSSNRSILFDFITSEEFSQQNVAQQIKEYEFQVENESLDFGITESEAEEIAKPDLFVPKPKTEKPISFSNKDKYSFKEWLHMMHLKPIERKEEQEKVEIDKENKHKKAETTPKMDQIDSFLKNNPKIKPIKNYVPKKEIKLKTAPSSLLMTETLARVYEEQKAYEKAIQAYKILILNNPQKSSFFANQIERLEQTIENNTK